MKTKTNIDGKALRNRKQNNENNNKNNNDTNYIHTYEYSMGAVQIPPQWRLLLASSMYLKVAFLDNDLILSACFKME